MLSDSYAFSRILLLLLFTNYYFVTTAAAIMTARIALRRCMSAAALSPCKWSYTRPRSARAFSSSFAPPDCALSPSEPHNSATTTPSAQVFSRPGRCCSTPVSRVFFGVRTRLRRRRAPPGTPTLWSSLPSVLWKPSTQTLTCYLYSDLIYWVRP
jgi:hypothetical protein